MRKGYHFTKSGNIVFTGRPTHRRRERGVPKKWIRGEKKEVTAGGKKKGSGKKNETGESTFSGRVSKEREK